MYLRLTHPKQFLTSMVSLMVCLSQGSSVAQPLGFEALRHFDVSSSLFHEPCASYSGTKYKLGFNLQQSETGFALIANSAELIESLALISDIPTNRKVKNCAGMVVDWWGRIYYTTFGLALTDGNKDLKTPYDLKSVADSTRIGEGFKIANACPSSASEDDYLRCIGLNRPNLEPEQYIFYSDSERIPDTLDGDYKQIMRFLIEMGLGYDRYIHAIYELDANNESLLSNLRELGLTIINPGGPDHGTLIQSIEQLHQARSCLGTLNAFHDFDAGRISTKKRYDFCVQQNPYSDPRRQFNREQDGKTFFYGVARNYLHEYFHHFQRSHVLNRDLGTATDCCGLENPVEAPPFWIEGAANVFPDLFLWDKFKELNHTVRNDFQRGNGEYHSSGSPAVCQGLDTYLCDQNKRLYREKKEQHQQNGGKCYLGARDGTDLYDGAVKQPQCDWTMAAWYLAYTTSFQVMWVDIPRDMWSMGFPASFEKNVGMTVNQFADKFSNFFDSGSPDEAPPPDFFPDTPLAELVDFWDLKANPSGVP